MKDPYPTKASFLNSKKDRRTVIRSLRAKSFDINEREYIYMFQLLDPLKQYYANIEKGLKPRIHKIQGGYFTVSQLREIYQEHGRPKKKGNYLDIADITDCSAFSRIQYKGCIYYIFGEIHNFGFNKSRRERCYSAGNIIDKIIEATRVRVDVYLEAEFPSDERGDLRGDVWSPTGLNSDGTVYMPFGDLFNYTDMINEYVYAHHHAYSHHEREYSNARFHYTDTRVSTVNGNVHYHDPMIKLFIHTQTGTPTNYKNFQYIELPHLYISFLKALFNVSINLRSTPYIKYLLEKRLMVYYPAYWKKIQKSISCMPDDIREKLYKYIIIEYGYRFEMIHREILLKYSWREYNNLLKTNMSLRRTFSPLINAMMNIYLLSRMFREETHKDNHIHSKIKIIYTGSEHSRDYVKFFSIYLNTKPDILEESRANGLEIPPNSIYLF